VAEEFVQADLNVKCLTDSGAVQLLVGLTQERHPFAGRHGEVPG